VTVHQRHLKKHRHLTFYCIHGEDVVIDDQSNVCDFTGETDNIDKDADFDIVIKSLSSRVFDGEKSDIEDDVVDLMNAPTFAVFSLIHKVDNDNL
jgi:hypothetical protein